MELSPFSGLKHDREINQSYSDRPHGSTSPNGTLTPAAATTALAFALSASQRHQLCGITDIRNIQQIEQAAVLSHAWDAKHLGDHYINLSLRQHLHSTR